MHQAKKGNVNACILIIWISYLSECRLEMASMFGRMQVEMSRANMCTATRRVVHMAKQIRSGVGKGLSP